MVARHYGEVMELGYVGKCWGRVRVYQSKQSGVIVARHRSEEMEIGLMAEAEDSSRLKREKRRGNHNITNTF